MRLLNLKLKTFTLLFGIMLSISCTKEQEPEDCNCGTILNDGIDNGCYWLEIESQCSKNRKTFCFDQSVWIDNHPGDNFCVTNESGW